MDLRNGHLEKNPKKRNNMEKKLEAFDENEFKKRILERINALNKVQYPLYESSMKSTEVNKSYDEIRIDLLTKENERLKNLNSELSTQNADLYIKIYKLQQQLSNINFRSNFLNGIKKEIKIWVKKIIDWFNT